MKTKKSIIKLQVKKIVHFYCRWNCSKHASCIASLHNDTLQRKLELVHWLQTAILWRFWDFMSSIMKLQRQDILQWVYYQRLNSNVRCVSVWLLIGHSAHQSLDVYSNLAAIMALKWSRCQLTRIVVGCKTLFAHWNCAPFVMKPQSGSNSYRPLVTNVFAESFE